MAEKETYDLKFKLLLIGDSEAGKINLLLRFSDDDALNTNLVSTIGLDFRIKSIELGGKKIKLQLWDSAGQERYRAIASSSHFRGAQGIMFIYSITNYRTFDSISEWLRNAKGHVNEDVQKVLVGNNCEMEDKRRIPREMGEQLAALHGIPFIETSTVDNINVEKAFLNLAQAILENWQKQDTEIRPKATVDLGKKNDEKSNCF